MTTFVEKIRDELVAASAVTDLVALRIYPSKAPQNAAPPYVVVTTISDIPEDSLTPEEDPLRDARVQVDCYAVTYLEVHAVARAVATVVKALNRPDLKALRLDSRDLYDDEAEFHRVSTDFSVWAGD